MWLDGRIGVRLVSQAKATLASNDAVLLRIGAGTGEQEPQSNGGETGWAAVRVLPDSAIRAHDTGCRCCGGRNGLEDALSALFAERARGTVPFFTSVVLEATPALFHDLVIILSDSATVSGRFRLEAEK